MMYTDLSLSTFRELQQLIDSTSEPDSPFHLSHASTTTDPTVYPPPLPSSPLSDEPQSKKRKASADGTCCTPPSGVASDTQCARFPHVVLANQHITEVHRTVKKECEQLADLSVSSVSVSQGVCVS